MNISELTERKKDIENKRDDNRIAMYELEKDSGRDDLIAPDSWATNLKNEETVLENELNDIKNKLAKLAIHEPPPQRAQYGTSRPPPSLTLEQQISEQRGKILTQKRIADEIYDRYDLHGNDYSSNYHFYADEVKKTERLEAELGQLLKKAKAANTSNGGTRRNKKHTQKHYKKRGNKAIRSRRTTRRYKKKRDKKSRRNKRYN